MDNKELNAVVSVLRGYASGKTGLRKPALIKIHSLLIEDLAKHRKINIQDDKSIMVSNRPDSESSDVNVGVSVA